MSLRIHKAVIDDLQQLQQICIEAYSQNFAHHWNEGGLDWYIDQQFSPDALRQTIDSLNSDYFIIYQDNLPIGFCKLSYGSDTGLPTPWLDLEKIYLLPSQKGNGVGKAILEFVAQLAQQQAKKELVLSVIDTNHAAIDFYRKNGFGFVQKTTLALPYFKEELKGAWLMAKPL
ncbi:GNAT family N-acetyltransferase [Spirosoma lituiforme]